MSASSRPWSRWSSRTPEEHYVTRLPAPLPALLMMPALHPSEVSAPTVTSERDHHGRLAAVHQSGPGGAVNQFASSTRAARRVHQCHAELLPTHSLTLLTLNPASRSPDVNPAPLRCCPPGFPPDVNPMFHLRDALPPAAPPDVNPMTQQKVPEAGSATDPLAYPACPLILGHLLISFCELSHLEVHGHNVHWDNLEIVGLQEK